LLGRNHWEDADNDSTLADIRQHESARGIDHEARRRKFLAWIVVPDAARGT